MGNVVGYVSWEPCEKDTELLVKLDSARAWSLLYREYIPVKLYKKTIYSCLYTLGRCIING